MKRKVIITIIILISCLWVVVTINFNRPSPQPVQDETQSSPQPRPKFIGLMNRIPKGKKDGFGIGLSMAQYIIKQFKGKITAKYTNGKLNFIVTLKEVGK
ncbi:hypothetical protein [Limosilactobacillus reuteri]|uniref:hypothetical protein n=1 Tax=Limosilactobacillus reuteri TaxID=1598 RepID=UPI001CDB41EB|nr:hypothetical protein [Limosilactobacillus reuteri]